MQKLLHISFFSVSLHRQKYVQRDGDVREIEAESGREKYRNLRKYTTQKNKYSFADVLSSDTSDEEKIKSIDDIWKDYLEYSEGK